MVDLGYPISFYRGLANKDFISNGQVLASAFQFDDKIREDGYKELSINWDDDDNSLNILLTQRKDNGKIQFVAGAAKLDLQRVNLILNEHINNGNFKYERRQLPQNKYHGNLLLCGTVNKQIRSLISHGLALAAGTNIIFSDTRFDEFINRELK